MNSNTLLRLTFLNSSCVLHSHRVGFYIIMSCHLGRIHSCSSGSTTVLIINRFIPAVTAYKIWKMVSIHLSVTSQEDFIFVLGGGKKFCHLMGNKMNWVMTASCSLVICIFNPDPSRWNFWTLGSFLTLKMLRWYHGWVLHLRWWILVRALFPGITNQQTVRSLLSLIPPCLCVCEDGNRFYRLWCRACELLN